MHRHLRNMAIAALTAGLLGGVAPLLGVAAATTATTTSPARYVRLVCLALNTFDNYSSDDSGPEKALKADKTSPESARRAIGALLASGVKATDTLVASTKAIGTPRIPNGQQTATDYLQTLGDIRDALSAGHSAAAHAPVTSKTVFVAALTKIYGNLSMQVQSIGDPLSTLNEDPTLAAAIQVDAGCATVLDFYSSATNSGLQAGDCVTADEQKVDCNKPHDGEVTQVTSYPAAATAPYPGNDALNAFADQTCAAAFTQYVGVPSEQTTRNYAYFDPSPGADWNGGDREIVCEVTNPDSTPLTGSVKGQAS